MRATTDRLAGLEQVVRQPRLALEADGPSDTKARERMEDAATAVLAKHGDSCSANRVDPDPMCLTSFGDDSTGPPAHPCSRDDDVVRNGAAAPKTCLLPLEMRSSTAAGGLFPPTKPLQRRRPSSTSHLFGSAFDRRDSFEDFNSIRFVLQWFLPACCPLLPEGH